MNKIVLIVPYYGAFPNYFQLFLKSCQNNPTVDWLIFTDIKDNFDYPKNVRKIEMSFDELRHRIQNKFDFPISLATPYKLCDYKPTYGYIFDDYLHGYDFWGHCDIDLIFGDIRKFITDDILKKYEKIGHLGHFTLYKNTERINCMFLDKSNENKQYQKVFTTNTIYVFDEWGESSINEIFLKNGISIYLLDDFFDVFPYDNNLKRVIFSIDSDNFTCKQTIQNRPSTIVWDSGRVYEYKKNNKTSEYLYVHLQKRTLNFDTSNIFESYIILSDRFEQYNGTQTFKDKLEIVFNAIFNTKKYKYIYNSFRYRVAEKTGPLRQKFQSK